MYKMELNRHKLITFFNLVIIFFISASDGLHFSRTSKTYAKYPKWNACVNASISFEFKTRFADSMLLYTDDNGKFDYVEIVLKQGSIRLRMNIVDGRDGSEEITLGNNLHDNRWHRVDLRRNRMESTLFVDGQRASKVAFGSDFNFGELSRNNFVFVGGLPEAYHTQAQNNLGKLSLSSVFFEPRFAGEIRNVFYGNCSCKLTRGEMIEGVSVSREPAEACEKANTCGADCLCISRDEGAGCQCKGFDCDYATSTYYRLPMDEVRNDTLVNPSGLDATVTGNPQLVLGVLGRALKIDEKFQKIKVSGPGHRNECFGDLELCPEGYTLALWVRFDEPGPGQGVYISNGAQSPYSHGVAMLYEIGRLEWVFKTKGTGHEWRVTANNVLPRHWYHVTVTWKASEGLALFIDGNKVAHSGSPKRGAATAKTSYNDDFIIGQSNDGTGSGALGTMTIDDFQFWSRRLLDKTLREKGPIYKHYISMDQFEDGQLIVPYLEPRIVGAVRQVPGKIGKAVELPGNNEYIDLGLFSESCLGNTSLCMYGFTVSFWINFKQLQDNAYYMASGLEGFTIFSYKNIIYATVQEGDRKWTTSTSGLMTGTWYFLEISWSRTSGLRLYVDRMLTSFQATSVHQEIRPTLEDRFYIGRANTYMHYEKYGDAMIDEIVVFNAERERLIAIDFILRGRPDKTHIGFDRIVGNKIDHPSIVIETTGSPSLVPGKIFDALRLNGSSQTAEFKHGDGCLGNLDYCLHGVVLAIWIRPEKFQDGVFYLSSGINGISMSISNGQLSVIVTTSTQRWRVITPEVTSIEWYYIEMSWHPDMGLKLYANNKLLAEQLIPEENTDTFAASELDYDKFVFGNNNGRKGGSVYGAATYDEMEFWLASREYLLAFEYIQRGRPTHYIISMDTLADQGKRLAHPVLPIILHGYPSLVPGVLREAMQLNALSKNAQYIDLGDQSDKCLGNLQKCKYGITMSFWIKIDNYYNNMFIFSTGLEGIRIYFQTGNIYFRIDNGDRTWRASIPKISERDWHLIELSWHREYGLHIYVDKELSAHAQYRTITPVYQIGTKEFYIGAPNSADSFGQKFSYGNLAVDEFEVWYSRREELLSFGYILRDYVEYESFSMENVTSSGNVILHARYNVTLEQGARLVPGKIGNAVSLDGKGQYVDLGEHMDTCMANLDLCDLGLTLALWLKPEQLQNNTYYLSGPMYSLYYANGKLKATFMSRGKVWNVETTQFSGDTWNNVMLSWDREDGLEMFVNNREVDDDRRPTEVMLGDQPNRAENLYIGKYAEAAASGSTTKMLADEVQYWYSNIDRMLTQGVYAFPVHEVIPIGDLARKGVLRLSSRNITAENGAQIAEGQHSKAIQLDGRTQYINMGKNLVCGGNLDECHQGFTLKFSTKPDKLVDNVYFFDSYPLSIFYSKSNSFGRLYATVRTSTKSWTVASPAFTDGEWQMVDVSWHPEIGLTMQVNDDDVGSHKTHGTDMEPVYNFDPRTFFGRSLEGWEGDRYAATSLETFEIWNVRRDVLLSNGGDVKFFTPKPETKPLVTSTAVPSDDSGSHVFVTTFPNGTTQVIGSGLIPDSTNSIIRFFGDSFVRYDFRDLPAEMLLPIDKEELSLQFLTKDTEGLIWLLLGQNGKKIHLSIKNGALLFVIQDGLRTPQQIIIRAPRGGAFNDLKWYTFSVKKEGKNLRFFINNEKVEEVTANSDIQFVSRGDFFLGGTASTSTNTDNLVNSNFDGGVTDVAVRKFVSPLREIIISFLQYIQSAVKTGDIKIIDRDDIGNYDWYPIATTPAPALPTPVTFTSASSVFYLRDPLDMRREGSSISFRFRTLEPRGLLAIARGSAQGAKFIAVEIFDGILYFLYDFGSFSSRKQFSARRVDDGEWHEVMIKIEGNRMTISLDGREIPTVLSQAEVAGLVFYRFYVGGYDNIGNVPWVLYSRIGYRGCLESLKINNIGVDLHSRFRDANIQGVEIGCRQMARYCQTKPCDHGFCKDLMDDYACFCPNTYYTGKDCNRPAWALSMDGTKSASYQFLNRELTHTNDLSVRFLTPLADTVLFTTEADNSDDFIRAELEEGRAKITVRVDGKTKTIKTGNALNDYNWHTLYIVRRADDIEVWVDDNARSADVIGGEGYQLMIDRIKFGSMGSTSSLSSNDYIGLMQNFIYDQTDVFTSLRPSTTRLDWIPVITPTNTPIPIYKPITVTSSTTYFRLPSMNIGRTMKILFKFRTRESNGLILYGKGNGNDAIAVELSNGQLRLAYNFGRQNMFTVAPRPLNLNDNEWHTVQISLFDNGQFSVRVDDQTLDVTNSDIDRRLDLAGNQLYIAGLPESMFRQPEVRNFIESRKGFRGCIASIDLNGAVPDLLASNYAEDKSLVVNGCTDLTVACKADVCGTGTCNPMIEDYWCDCNMTGFVGTPCITEPVGYYFGKNNGKGIAVYTFPHEQMFSSDLDNIAFGFKTYQENGVLYRVESALDEKEYIEIRMEDGYIIAESNTGGGIVSVSERSRKFNDGGYHVVRYIRTGSNSTLQVNQLPSQITRNTGIVSLLDKVHTVIIGGRKNEKGQQVANFNGIIGGLYYNGYRWMDLLYRGQQLHGKLVQTQGDVVLSKPFILIKGGTVTVSPTAGPPPIYIAPDPDLPADIGGIGFSENPPSGEGGVPPVIGIGDAGGIGTFPGSGIYVPGSPNVAESLSLLGPAPPPSAFGTRAGVVVGSVLGTLAFLTSMMWALYQLKPGVPNCLSPGAGAAGGGGSGGGGGGMVISAPRATSNLAAVQAASAGGGGGGGAGSGGAGAGKVTVVNGAASGGGGAGAGGGSSTYTSFYQSSSTAVGGGGAGGGAGAGAGGTDQFDSATLRATGTFSNKGTSIGSPGAGRANMASSSSYHSNYQSNTLQSTQSYASGQGSPGGGGAMNSASYSDRQYLAAGDGIPDYDLPVAGTLQSGNSYSSSTLNTAYNYQINNTNSQSQRHTSVLTLILGGNRPSSPIPVRHEVYSSAMAASGDQTYVDRSEDLVVEKPRSVVFIRPILIVEDTPSETTSSVTLKTGTSAQASYSAHYDSSTYSSIQDMTSISTQNLIGDIGMSTSSSNASSGNRKASLQIFPKSGKVGYNRLENSSSEIDISNRKGNARSFQVQQLDASNDNMYESTTTVTSSILAGSVDTNLDEEAHVGEIPESLDSLMANFADFKTDFSSDLGDFSMITSNETVYAQVDKSKKSKSNDDTTAASIELKDLGYTEAGSSVKVVETDTKSISSASSSSSSSSSSSDDSKRKADKAVSSYGGMSLAAHGNQTDRSETVVEVKRSTYAKQASKTSSSSVSRSDGTVHSSSSEFHITSAFPSTSSSSAFKTSRMTSIGDGSSTLVIALEGSTGETVQTVSGGDRNLDAELDANMTSLLTGIDVDANKWTQLKDVSSFEVDTPQIDDWEVQNLKTVTLNRQGQYVMSGMSGGAVTPGAAADEVRVDCCLITSDGCHVVTGSSLGAPQVWDMQSGELKNIMKGDTVGSTGLHLVCGDRLLVGAVHADMEINEYSGRKGVFNHHLQIWDFMTGKPLSMAEGEYCSALCPLSDDDKIMFGRTDKFGDATSIIVWDLMGNQMIKEMRYDAPVGNNEYISYLNLSKNDRYVVAGFTNSFDNYAEFMTFDMTLTSYNISEPAMLKLDANLDCTAMMPKDEAVTGLRNGDLVIWNIRTAQPSRQLLGSGGAHAHTKEVKTVTLSKDSKYLVSGSADGTLKVWDMHTERPVHTLNGHTDEVWCSAISEDNEIVVSGSSDGTIRLWRMKNGTEMCVFNCGVDIFSVRMSRDKGTIVALGDKFGARKLIMLQVVRTKIKKIVSN